jgi:hypothetical protein
MSATWFIQEGQQERGPYSQEQMLAMLRTGELPLTVYVRKAQEHVGQPASDYEDLKLQTHSPTPSTPTRGETHPAEYVGYFISRVVRSDFSSIAATAHERQVLDHAAAPITLGLAQDYVAWRRSVLAVAVIFLTVQLCFGWELTGKFNSSLQGWAYTVYLIFKISLLASQWIAWGCLVIACLAWDQLRLSMLLARCSWLVMLLVPMVLFLLPFERFMGLGNRTDFIERAVLEEGDKEVFKEIFSKDEIAHLKERIPSDQILIGFSIAQACFQWLFPKVIGLFPGLIRCAMTLKSLLPESPTLGWIVLIVSPLYAMLLFMLLAISVHVAQSWFTPLGFLLLALGPVIYLLNYQVLISSYPETTGQPLIRRIRMLSIGLTLAGLVLLLIKADQLFLLFKWHPSGWQILHLLASIFASVLLLSVVGADFLLAVLLRTHESQQSFQGTKLQTAMLKKLTELANVGMTKSRT